MLLFFNLAFGTYTCLFCLKEIIMNVCSSKLNTLTRPTNTVQARRQTRCRQGDKHGEGFHSTNTMQVPRYLGKETNTVHRISLHKHGVQVFLNTYIFSFLSLSLSTSCVLIPLYSLSKQICERIILFIYSCSSHVPLQFYINVNIPLSMQLIQTI